MIFFSVRQPDLHDALPVPDAPQRRLGPRLRAFAAPLLRLLRVLVRAARLPAQLHPGPRLRAVAAPLLRLLRVLVRAAQLHPGPRLRAVAAPLLRPLRVLIGGARLLAHRCIKETDLLAQRLELALAHPELGGDETRARATHQQHTRLLRILARTQLAPALPLYALRLLLSGVLELSLLVLELRDQG